MRYKKINPFEEKEAPKKKNGRKYLILALSMIILGGVYIFGISNQIEEIVYTYYVLLMLSLVAFLVLNHGISNRLLTPENLPQNWSEEKKLSFLKKDEKRRSVAKKLLYIIIPLLLIFNIDMIYMILS